MRWLSLARKRVRQHLAALAAVWATLFVSLLVLGALQLFSLVIGEASARGALDNADPGARTIAVTASIKSGTLPQRRAEVADAAAAIPGARIQEAVTATALGLAAGEATDRAVLAELPSIQQAASLDAGAWPTATAAGEPLEVVIPAGTAKAAGWSVGQELELPSLVNAEAPPVAVKVVGTFTPKDPQDILWLNIPLALDGVSEGDFTAYGPLVVAPGSFDGDLGAGSTASWRVSVPWERMDLRGAATLRADVAQTVATLKANPALRPITGLDGLLGEADVTANRVRIALLTPAVLLMLLGGTALTLGSVQLSSLRAGETALLRSRGASNRQILLLVAVEALLLVGSALLATLVLAPALVKPLAEATGLLAADADLRAGLATREVWVTLAVSTVLGAAIMLLTGARGGSLRTEGPQTARLQRLARLTGSGLDVGLIALGVLGVLQLQRYDAAAPRLDPLTIAAPAMVVSGLAVVALRIIPYAARWAARLGDRSTGLGLAWGAWQIARRIAGQGTALLLLLLALSMGTLALGQQRTLNTALEDQSEFSVGAPVVVDLAPGANTPASAARFAELAGGPERSMAVYRGTAVAPGLTTATTVLAVDASAGRAGYGPRPDLVNDRDWTELLAQLRNEPLGTPLPDGASSLSVEMTIGRLAAFGADTAEAIVYFGLPNGTRVQGQLPIARIGTNTLQLKLTDLALPPGSRLVGLTLRPNINFQLPKSSLQEAIVTVDKVLVDGAELQTGGRLVSRASTGVLVIGLDITAEDIPVLMTPKVAAASKLTVGKSGTLPLLLGARPVKLIGLIDALPSASPDASMGVLADLGTVNDALFFPQSYAYEPNAAALTPQSYWLAPADVAGAAATLRADNDIASLVTTGDEVLEERRSGAVNSGMRWAMRMVTGAAALLAILGFAATTAALGAARAHDSAVLAALGMPPKGIRRVLIFERLAVVLVTALAGLGLGLAASGLVVPLLVGADGHPQVPPIRLVLDLPAVLLFAAALAIVLSLVAALVVSRTVRNIAAHLREGER